MYEYNNSNCGCNKKPHRCNRKNIMICKCFKWNFGASICEENSWNNHGYGESNNYNYCEKSSRYSDNYYEQDFDSRYNDNYGDRHQGCQKYYPSNYFCRERF